ncbi:MAG: hypothetical protein HN509_09540 [Halobacteriovoraceae bacterium]|jgi:hypothetical protein|nr:hypothetical protein [Halobacteriovoraceae bacterium]MBT5094882.1 hypothetical protein [Halobacteriovoraceae bacterium]
MQSKNSRRAFFKVALTAFAALPLIKATTAFAADKCPSVPTAGKALKKLLRPDSKTAKRIKYVVDATASKHKKYKKGNACKNCKFYKVKKEENGYAPCQMAANKYVTTCGWCKQFKLDKKKA